MTEEEWFDEIGEYGLRIRLFHLCPLAAEWNFHGTNPRALVGISERKLRLSACAALRRVWDSLCAESTFTVRRVEASLDGGVPPGLFPHQYLPGRAGCLWLECPFESAHRSFHAAAAAWRGDGRTIWNPEYDAQSALLRDVVGNPFRKVVISPASLTEDVRLLAEAAYRERLLPSGLLDPVRLAVLADSCEEQGVAAEVLGHLRDRGPHYRGCWPVDALTGRS